MSLWTDKIIYIIAHDYAFCPIDGAKYEPYVIAVPERMVILASPKDSINILIKYDQSGLEPT